MKYIKIQQDMLKAIEKGNYIDYRISVSETDTAILFDHGTAFVVMPNKLYCLNRDLTCFSNFDYKSLVDFSGERGAVTPEQRVLIFNGKQRTYIKIHSANREEWVDKQLLRYFDNPQFEMSDKQYSPIKVYEGKIIVGIVCPFKITKCV